MKVLVAVDDSEYTQYIEDFITGHEWPAHTEFKVMTVVEPLKYGSPMAVLPGPILDEIFDDNWKAGQKLVRRVAMKLRDVFKSEHIQEEVVEGFPKSEVLKAAEVWPADLIVMGSHGRHGFDRIIMGSVSLFMVSHAQCSVLIIRPPLSQKGKDAREKEARKELVS